MINNIRESLVVVFLKSITFTLHFGTVVPSSITPTLTPYVMPATCIANYKQ